MKRPQGRSTGQYPAVEKGISGLPAESGPVILRMGRSIPGKGPVPEEELRQLQREGVEK